MKFTFEQTVRNDYIPIYNEISFMNNAISVFPYSIRNNNEIKENIIANLPYIVINSYAQNTVLNEVMNVIGEAFKGLKRSLGSNTEGDTKEISFTVEQLKAFANAIQDVCKGLTSQQGVLDFASTVSNAMNHTKADGQGDIALTEFPAQLYYALLGSTRLGRFVLPFINIEGYMQTNGTYGYSKSENILNGILPNNALLNLALGNVGLNIMPMFKPGSSLDDVTISFTVNLINDTIEAAATNFEFLCSLFGGNKWVQYGFVQFPGALYDIVIPGAMRYMLCTGSFTVEPIGSIRKLEHPVVSFDFKAEYIPDVYSLKLQFNTLLPNNFNTFIYHKWLKETEIMYDNGKSSIPGFIKGLAEALNNISFGEKTRRALKENIANAEEKYNATVEQRKAVAATINGRFGDSLTFNSDTGEISMIENGIELSSDDWEEFNTLRQQHADLIDKEATAKKELEAAKQASWTTTYQKDVNCKALADSIQQMFDKDTDISKLKMSDIKAKYNALTAENKKQFDEQFIGSSVSKMPDDMSLVQFVAETADRIRQRDTETIKDNQTAAKNSAETSNQQNTQQN